MRTNRYLLSSGIAFLIGMMGPAIAADANKSPYPSMAPIAQYRMTSADEVAMARSAGPPSIAADAGVLVMGEHNYETVAKSKNGWVCLVERSWTASLDDPEFWNPKIRGPVCLNAAAVRSELPHVVQRTEWALSGVSRDEMLVRTKAMLAAGKFMLPEAGAMSFMLSKEGYLSDQGGRHGWHPHVMFFAANTKGVDWGADLPGSPVFAGPMNPEPETIFFVPVPKWSDGTPDSMHMN